MNDEFPDPSLVNTLDFYSSAFHIKRLLRRRGWEDVVPFDGKPVGFMPRELFKSWSSFTQRKKLIAEKYGGKEFERFVAQIILQRYCNPATYSNKVLDLAPGGDFDILVEAPGEILLHFETKTSIGDTSKNFNIPDMWNFMVRETRLGADMSVFLLDVNYDLEQKLLRVFELLYALAEQITVDNVLLDPDQIPEKLLQEEPDSFTSFHRKAYENIYYLYYPTLVINGGDNIQKNIGKAIALYYSGIRHMSPFSRLSKMRTGLVFQNLPHWNDLPKQVKREAVRKRIMNMVR
jgi:hypothetical protein